MQLATWDQFGDAYNFPQLANNWQIIDFHDHSPGHGVQIPSAGIANNAIGSQHLSATLAQSAGLNSGSLISRGAVFNAGPGTRTNTAYGPLGDAADQVSVTLPTNGIILISYQAQWQESTAGQARAAIWIGGTRLQVQAMGSGGSTPVTQAAATNVTGFFNKNIPLFTSAVGLFSGAPTNSSGSAVADVSTGQVIGMLPLGGSYVAGETNDATITTYAAPMGGPCAVFAAANTYVVSVQFKALSGSVTASNRRLWVSTLSFS